MLFFFAHNNEKKLMSKYCFYVVFSTFNSILNLEEENVLFSLKKKFKFTLQLITLTNVNMY